ncbi:nucleotidyltransferase domain-containing protein [Ruania halotolerans]|uniref:nucleotidyltransferase domain-containing protein n=1 Tax=Ruania halotolerans TaxID=2897773 RepID=UPI001E56B40C|nr:nucleotidyltransferase domain-containing protein [Ruania halotolerans]UFU07545.1 nucleotidyltransferase domain-containing protein [Ruania halotolerans]
MSRPMTAVVPSLEGPVLEVLAGTSRALTGREAHRLAGTGSESGVRLVLNRMVEHGLVHATRAGRATMYVANRDHIAWPAVRALTELRQELFDRLRDLIMSWEIEPTTVAVFGSAARGDGGVDSDVDILIVHHTADEPMWTSQVDTLRESVLTWTGNHCQVYDITDTDFARHVTTGEAIVDEWRRDAVVVFGTLLDRLIRKELH